MKYYTVLWYFLKPYTTVHGSHMVIPSYTSRLESYSIIYTICKAQQSVETSSQSAVGYDTGNCISVSHRNVLSLRICVYGAIRYTFYYTSMLVI